MRVAVEHVTRLRFDDGSPVRAASAIEQFAGGWLVAQDDATHAAWWHKGSVQPVRVLPPVEGHEVFDDASGTKHLKPDLEAACPVEVDGHPAVLFLGSGSRPARMRGAVVGTPGTSPHVEHADLSQLYAAVAGALSVSADQLNLEGACVVGSRLRWFHRGMPSAGLPTGSIDLDLAQLLGAVRGQVDPGDVGVERVRDYDLGAVEGVGLAATDAVVLPSSGSGEPALLLSTAAEDTPNPRDDGPVVGSGLVVIEGTRVVASAPLPDLDGRVCKVEGLALVQGDGSAATVLATVDADDHTSPSLALLLRVQW